MVARMRHLSLTVAVTLVLGSTLAAAQPDGGSPACSPKARFHVWFDRVELIKVSQTLSDVTCKPVVLGPGVENVMITVVTPEQGGGYTAHEFLKIVTQAAEVNGATIVENKGVIRIVLAPKK